MDNLMIKKGVPLGPLTTFGTGGPARYFVALTSALDLLDVYQFAESENVPVFILGGGSNMVISDQGFNGLVLSIDTRGMELISEDNDSVTVRVGSGENWDDVVAWTVEHNWWGLENLSLIPGKMGGFAVQNVGAYGAEASEVVSSVDTYDTKVHAFRTFSADECKFSYRASVFNTVDKGRYLILSTTMKLSKKPNPRTNYSDVKKYFEDRNITEPTIQQIREAIVAIRTRKFPNIKHTGTAGSFFKNLYLTQSQYESMYARIREQCGQEKADALEEIKNKFPSGRGIKIPTAFIIDHILELKGARVGGAQVSPTQALAIINPEKKASSDDVLMLVKKVRGEIYCTTGIEIAVEPEFIGFSLDERKEMFALPESCDK